MALYQYATTSGGLSKEFEAANQQEALQKLSTFTDVAKGSGVLAVSTPATPTPTPAPKTEPTFTPTGITSPTPAPVPVDSPTLPTPTAPVITESFFTSSAEQVGTARQTLEKAYEEQLKTIDTQRDEAQKKIDELTEKQEMMLETDIQPLLQPFREQLEKTERERLYINENFEANQALVRELETLLSEGNTLISQQKAKPLALSVLNKRVSKTIADVTARAGVIKAVMSARSGQIAEAYRLIDRTVNAITADRRDQLAYYETVFNFYESQKDEEGRKLINLDKDQAKFVEEQINLLKGDLQRAEKNADNIKNLMTDPDTALFMAKAGITIDDSPEVVARKMAQQAEREEVANFKNEMIADGYTFVPFAQAGAVAFEVAGQKLYFKAPPGKSRPGFFTDSSGNTLSAFDAARQFVNDNPEATDAELKSALLQLNTERKLGLSVTDINSIVETRTIPALTIDDVRTKVVDTLTAQSGTLSRSEAKKMATNQLKKALGLKDADSLPDAYSNAIEDALVEVYGSTFMQNVIPGGRGSFMSLFSR